MTFEKIRYLWKFETIDGEELVFPQYRYEFEPVQTLTAPMERAVGQDYAYDLFAGRPALEDVAIETVRFSQFNHPEESNPAIDEMLNILHTGVGRLWTRTESDYDPPRWAWARLVEMPGITVSGLSYFETPVILRFARLSRWFGETLISVANTVDSDGETWVVNNPSSLPAYAMSITLRPIVSAGIPNPFTVVNTENGYEYGTTFLSSTTAARRRLVTHRFYVSNDALLNGPRFETSNDAGATFFPALNIYDFPTSPQPLLSFKLEPGDNTLQGNGVAPNVEVLVEFYPEFLR